MDSCRLRMEMSQVTFSEEGGELSACDDPSFLRIHQQQHSIIQELM